MRSAAALILFFLFFLPGVESAPNNTVPPKLEGWYLVWHDEFDGDKVDPAKWKVEDAALVKNKELEYYSPANVYVKDGKLVLKSERKEQ
ncbi:MAG: hypothetical protein PHR22_01740, partial [Candidatus Omnitrophica bacterium]|nr:hypothetical protein [Candidatus Omnitrophota bacterium]